MYTTVVFPHHLKYQSMVVQQTAEKENEMDFCIYFSSWAFLAVFVLCFNLSSRFDKRTEQNRTDFVCSHFSYSELSNCFLAFCCCCWCWSNAGKLLKLTFVTSAANKGCEKEKTHLFFFYFWFDFSVWTRFLFFGQLCENKTHIWYTVTQEQQQLKVKVKLIGNWSFKKLSTNKQQQIFWKAKIN